MTPQRPSIPEIFKPEDFTNLAPGLEDLAYGKVISRQAQSIFASWLESQKVVFAGGKSLSAWSDKYITGDSHLAYLVCPTELKPEKCEHKEVYIFDLTLGNYAFKCRDCDKKVGPKNGWEEAE